jgi:hypothetical protein
MKSNNLPALKGLLVAAVGGILLLSACGQDETTQNLANSEREVTFSAHAKKGSRTRVAETTTSDILNFNVFAIWTNNGKPLDNLAPAAVSRLNASSPWDYNPKQLWPKSDKIDFYAFSPNDGTVSPNYSSANYTNMSIDYTVPAIGSQQDLLVAVNDEVHCANPGTVSLRFQHALSRIQLKARSAIVGSDITVYGVSFLNLKSSGTLALNSTNIPKTGGFNYDDGNPNRVPKVLWTSPATPANYEFDLTSNVATVENDGYGNVIVGADALMVLPQLTALGGAQPIESEDIPGFDDLSDLSVTDPTDGNFYIKIVFAEEGSQTIHVRYYAVKDPSKTVDTPLSFEAGRNYTFVVDLSDSEFVSNIGFSVEVQDIDDVPDVDITPAAVDPDPAENAEYLPKPHKGFAGSNIYWDKVNQRMTFDDVDVTIHETYQGLYFKWSSLIGISSKSTPNVLFGNDYAVYVPDANGDYTPTTITDAYNDGIFATEDWYGIPMGSDRNFVQDPLGGVVTDYKKSGFVSYLNTVPSEVAAYRGDICAYLSGRPGIPEGFWRLPTANEFLVMTPTSFPVEGTYPTPPIASNEEDGTSVFDFGRSLQAGFAPNATNVFFPASGFRYGDGSVDNIIGYQAGYASASPAPTTLPAYQPLGFTDSGIFSAINSQLDRAISVRCVKK